MALAPLDKLEGLQTVRELTRRFDDQKPAYMAAGYKEAQVRREFIDPFFAALGWDIENRAGRPEPYKEVIHEDALRVGTSAAAPDYAFRLGESREFFVEAKKPSVNVYEQVSAAFQLRRYAWSAKLPLSVVTDFEEFAIYDCRAEPYPTDNAATARIFYAEYGEYEARWDEIHSLLSKGAVQGGSIPRFIGGQRRPRGRQEVDAAFLQEIQRWRERLAHDIAARNPELSTRDLNQAVQTTIDRIVFLRICEDRGIEEQGQLADAASGTGVYGRLGELYRRADDRYNSGLFHFHDEPGRQEPPDRLTLDLEIGDQALQGIIERLYFPNSPYEFSFLPVDILGQVYEQFLGQVITLTEKHEAVIEDKPEVRRAGGVFYTPTHIVDSIVRETIAPLVEESTPRKVSSLRIVDPACGSGSFLLGAYEYLLRWHRDWYLTHRPERHTRQLYQGRGGQWYLTTEEKRRILLNNVYGVDIDSQAVEVTKLSLLLKVLEGETEQSLSRQLQLLQERALPDLAKNIKWGNSLVGTEVFAQGQLDIDDEETWLRINPFEWRDAFPDIFEKGGFDAVIGNPPWLMAGYYLQDSIDYLRSRFETATGKFDVYYLFIERACQLVSPQGRIGLIVPNKFFHTTAAKQLRRLLGDGGWIRKVTDFRQHQVFIGATNYSCVLNLQVGAKDDARYVRATPDLDYGREISVPRNLLSEAPWYFLDRPTRELFDKVKHLGTPLEDLVDRFGTGVQSGADTVLLLRDGAASEARLESELLRPLLRGRDIRRYGPAAASRSLIFPYEPSGTDDRFELLPEDVIEQQYPCAWKRLGENREALARRRWFNRSAEELSGGWYGLMYLDAPSTFERPHLLTPSLTDAANFTIGNGSLFATGTAGVTSVVLSEDTREDILYVLAVLNSRLLSNYAVAFSPIFSGGYFKFSGPYIRHLPIRRIRWDDQGERNLHDQIVELATERLAIEAGDGQQAAEITGRRAAALEHEIDVQVNKLYELTDEDGDVLAAFELLG